MKTAFVTGTSSGIGKSIAKELFSKGKRMDIFKNTLVDIHSFS